MWWLLIAVQGEAVWRWTLVNIILVLIWLYFECIQTDRIPFLCFLCMAVACSLLSFTLLVSFTLFIILFRRFDFASKILSQEVSGIRTAKRHTAKKKRRKKALLSAQRWSQGGYLNLLFFVTSCCWAEVKCTQQVERVELDLSFFVCGEIEDKCN